MPRNDLRSNSGSNVNMATLSEHSLSSQTWNTRRLGQRLGVDIASAVAAGALTCPLVTIIDR